MITLPRTLSVAGSPASLAGARPGGVGPAAQAITYGTFIKVIPLLIFMRKRCWSLLGLGAPSSRKRVKETPSHPTYAPHHPLAAARQKKKIMSKKPSNPSPPCTTLRFYFRRSLVITDVKRPPLRPHTQTHLIQAPVLGEAHCIYLPHQPRAIAHRLLIVLRQLNMLVLLLRNV